MSESTVATRGMRLKGLTITGEGKSPAIVDFSEPAMLISGASDTGKSYIFKAIDFALGAKSLKTPPEAAGYTHAELCVSLPQRGVVTFRRPLSGGPIDVFEGDLWERQDAEPFLTLAPRHRDGGRNGNISEFLLGQLGMVDVVILWSKRTQATRNMSFRELARFCLIDESRVTGETTPATPEDRRTNDTLEKNILAYILTGRDQSNVAPLGDGKSDTSLPDDATIDRVVHALGESLGNYKDKEEAAKQCRLFEDQLRAETTSLHSALERRTEIVSSIAELENQSSRLRGLESEAQELLSRFNLLHQQYQSDINRLDLAREAGNLLRLFDLEICPICGATEENQHRHAVVEDGDGRSWTAAVQAEIDQIRRLDHDLEETMDEIRREIRDLSQQMASLETQDQQQRMQLRDLTAEITPSTKRLEELNAGHADVLKVIQTFEQIQTIESLRSKQVKKKSQPARVSLESFEDQAEVAEFERMISQNLVRWGIQDGREVRFDIKSCEIFVGGQARRNHGKGMRAIIHAAFTIALGDHSIRAGRPAPGFVVLDSPVLTYRDADRNPNKLSREEALDDAVEQLFYRDLSNHDCQIVVMENSEPSADLRELSHVHFTGNRELDRYGFFPNIS